MGGPLQPLGDWGHALAAALFAALAIWVSRGRRGGPERGLLIAALGCTALWALYTAFSGVERPLSGIAESIRNGAWLLFLFVLLHRGEGRQGAHPMAVTALYGVLGGLLVAQTAIDLIPAPAEIDPGLLRAAFNAIAVLRMMVAVGGLILVHHLYTISAPESRVRIGLLLAAIVAMWTYDLTIYALAWLSKSGVGDLFAMRGLLMAVLAPAVALSIKADDEWRLALSRTVAFRSLSIVAVGLYLVFLAGITAAIEVVAGPDARLVEMGLVFALAVAALVILPSQRVRAWLQVKVSKHFFQHRYDYRAEWTRFAETIGQPEDETEPFDQRVVKAVADITGSPAGLLMLRDETGGLALQARWNWRTIAVPLQAMTAEDAADMKRSGWIADFQSKTTGLPTWMVADPAAWALVPLIHRDRLIGAILLARPLVNRRLDWEDFDMLRTVGRQAASHIREAQGQQALDDARRFDEFNRRFAFIMHDIKNLVSQLSLLARNAERHADNPEFRADMIITLQESVGKMNDLLARLSQHHKGRQEEPRPVSLRPIAEKVARAKGHGHPVELTGSTQDALADPSRIEQILAHLVQNAIDASADDRPVHIRLSNGADWASVEILDHGCGMTSEFIRRELFRPFASSKPGGFGIGAFEARELARSMNGRIEVQSRPGEGSRFTLSLPLAPARHDAIDTGRAA